jgi:hypothetical protein
MHFISLCSLQTVSFLVCWFVQETDGAELTLKVKTKGKVFPVLI